MKDPRYLRYLGNAGDFRGAGNDRTRDVLNSSFPKGGLPQPAHATLQGYLAHKKQRPPRTLQ